MSRLNVRPTLHIEAILVTDIGMENEAMDALRSYMSRIRVGRPPETFGYTYMNEQYQLTPQSKKAPRIHFALYHVVKTFFQVEDVFAMRLGKGVRRTDVEKHTDRCMLIYYYDDSQPYFHFYETSDTAIEIQNITQSKVARFVLCLIKQGCQSSIDFNTEISQELAPEHTAPETEQEEPIASQDEDLPTMPTVGGALDSIPEEDAEGAQDEMMLETFYAELTASDLLQDSDDVEIGLPPAAMFSDVMQISVRPNDDEIRDEPSMQWFYHTEDLPYLDDDEVQCYDDLDSDELGTYMEICTDYDMSPIMIDEDQWNSMQLEDVATLRVYVSISAKRAVVVKEDDLPSKQVFADNVAEVTSATIAELKTWLSNNCFKMCLLKIAQNVMTSRYVAKWKWMKNAQGKQVRQIRMRLCLRGFMDLEAFSVDTFSGTARRQSQRLLASEAACHPEWIIASLDIDKAFLKGFTYKELAEATGEKERIVCFRLPPGSASLLRKFPGFETYDETIHCLQCIKPGTGTKDAPRAFSLKLRQATQSLRIGLMPTAFDPEFEFKKDLMTAKHVDDVNMAGTEKEIDRHHSEVEKVFGSCKMNKHVFTNCGVRYAMHVIMDQDVYIATMRPVAHSELTGAAAVRSHFGSSHKNLLKGPAWFLGFVFAIATEALHLRLASVLLLNL